MPAQQFNTFGAGETLVASLLILLGIIIAAAFICAPLMLYSIDRRLSEIIRLLEGPGRRPRP